jgi:hypothetical protein
MLPMRRLSWMPVVAVLAAVACGGRLAPVPGSERDGGRGIGSDDGSVDGGADDGSSPDGDAEGPPPVPDCSGANSMCIPPDAGIVWHGAAIVQCQPEQYPGPWTMILERQTGTTFQVVQELVVYPGENVTFDDTNAPPSQVMYRVCSVSGTDTVCGDPFITMGAPNCGCEPTSCWLQSACNTTIDDYCGATLQCGACTNGNACNAQNNCCPAGFMPSGWGRCVCAPPAPCGKGEIWNWAICQCMGAGGCPVITTRSSDGGS